MTEDDASPYVEEPFGILTDDDLYLDCVLVRPADVADEELRSLRAWVPRYPLTKSSVITCARQEVSAYGADRRSAHLVFDLRGTGDSEGSQGDHDFETDLQSIRAWATERFGDINFGFLGQPGGGGAARLTPIRPGVVAENYHYSARGKPAEGARQTILFLATYGHFDRTDDTLCAALANQGHDVYGMDPLRYLLHARVRDRLTPADLAADFQALGSALPEWPIMIGQPVSAGLALLWASVADKAPGVIAIGRAQLAFQAEHIFRNYNPHTFFLPRFVSTIAPRPAALVLLSGHPLGGEAEELESLYASAAEPRRLDHAPRVDPGLLLALINWLMSNSAPPGHGVTHGG
jgi:hypothetical protein